MNTSIIVLGGTGEFVPASELPQLFAQHADSLASLAPYFHAIRSRIEAAETEDDVLALNGEVSVGIGTARIVRTMARFAVGDAIAASMSKIEALGELGGYATEAVNAQKAAMWAKLADVYKLTPHRLMNITDTAEAYAPEERIFALSFEHYAIVQSSVNWLRAELLTDAVNLGWTRDNLAVQHRKRRREMGLDPPREENGKVERETQAAELDTTQREDKEDEDPSESQDDYRDVGASDSLDRVLEDLKQLEDWITREYMRMTNNAVTWSPGGHGVQYRDIAMTRANAFKSRFLSLRNRLLKLAQDNGYDDLYAPNGVQYDSY